MEEIIKYALTLMCGGGLGWLINWKANRRKANGEAIQVEAEALKQVQDYYQQAISDQQDYITKQAELRNQLIAEYDGVRRENGELRKRQDDMDEKIRNLTEEVSQNSMIITKMRPLLCGRIGCQQRIGADLEMCGSNCSKKTRKGT